MAAAEKRPRSSPTGFTPVQLKKKTSRTIWTPDEFAYLQQLTMHKDISSRTMEFWRECAEKINDKFCTYRTAQMCRCRFSKVKNLLPDFNNSAADSSVPVCSTSTQTEVSENSTTHSISCQTELAVPVDFNNIIDNEDQDYCFKPVFKNSDATPHEEIHLQSILLERFSEDQDILTEENKFDLIKAIFNANSKKSFIDFILSKQSLKEIILNKFCNELERNATSKCIRSDKSVLFPKKYEDLKNLNFSDMLTEMIEANKLLLKFLLAVTMPKHRMERSLSPLIPKLGLIYSVLMSHRFHELSRLQRVMSATLMDEQVHEKVFDRLQKMGICSSFDVSNRVLEEIGGHFNSEVVSLIKFGTNFRLIGDNVNFVIGVKNERTDSKPQICNWFASAIILQIHSFPELPDIRQGNTKDSIFSNFVPSGQDEQNLKNDYQVLISRVAKVFLPQLTFLYENKPKHILGPYSHLYKQTNLVMPTKVLPLNEQNYADCVKILDDYENIIHDIHREAGMDTLTTVHIGGDQLTRERFTGAKSLRSGCFSATERLEHLSPITFELWHTAMNFLKLIFQHLYNKNSGDRGTLEGERILRHRESVKEDVKNNYDQDKDFFISFLKSYIIEALCSFFGLETLTDNPRKNIPPTNVSKEDRLKWVKSTMDKFIDVYVFARNSGASVTQQQEIDETVLIPITVRLPGGAEITIHSKQKQKVLTPGLVRSDKIMHYGHIVLELGLLYMQFLDVCKTPDRDRLLYTLKYMMVSFKASNHLSKYALEILRFLAHQQATYSLRTAHQCLYGLFVNTQGKIDSNIPADLQMEHIVKRVKKVLKSSAPNNKQDSAIKKTKALCGLEMISKNFDDKAKVLVRYSSHKTKSSVDDEYDIIKDLREIRPFEVEYDLEDTTLRIGYVTQTSIFYWCKG